MTDTATLGQELFNACVTGTEQLVQKYLDLGADSNYRDPKSGLPCLHKAVRRNRTEVVEILLERGADPNARDADGNTPLLLAANNKHPNTRVISALMAYGADPNLPRIDAEGRACETPLHNCAKHSATNGIALLLQGGADSSLINAETGNTPLEEVNMFFKGVQKPFHQYRALPAIDRSRPFTRADVLASNTENMSALDNPLTWRYLADINATLRRQGEEPIGKAGLLDKNFCGKFRAVELLESGLFRPVAHQLQAEGVPLDVSDFLKNDQLAENLAHPDVLRVIFSPANYTGRGLPAFERNLADLPGELRGQVGNLFSLRVELQRQEKTRTPAVAGR